MASRPRTCLSKTIRILPKCVEAEIPKQYQPKSKTLADNISINVTGCSPFSAVIDFHSPFVARWISYQPDTWASAYTDLFYTLCTGKREKHIKQTVVTIFSRSLALGWVPHSLSVLQLSLTAVDLDLFSTKTTIGDPIISSFHDFTPWVKNMNDRIFHITSPSIDQFSKYFHCQTR